MPVARVIMTTMLKEFHNDLPEGGETIPVDLEIIDIKRLQMFYVAVKMGTFSAAAQSLGLSPSAVSHALKSLEEDVDCSLFKRSGPHVSPTGAAMRLMPIVEDMLFRMGSIRSELAKMDGRVERLRFGVSGSSRVVLTTSVMSAFCECFPDAEVEIVQTPDHGDHRLREDLDFELGCDETVPTEVIRRRIAEEAINLYAAPFHELGLARRVTVPQLLQHVLVFPDKLAADIVARDFFQKPGSRLKRWIMPDAGAARSLAIQGQCVAFLPESVAKIPVETGTLIRVTNAVPVLSRKYSAWWRPGRPLPWIAEVFLSLLAVNFNQED
jgi:DNA-binding transcriptional LysR family regulator